MPKLSSVQPEALPAPSTARCASEWSPSPVRSTTSPSAPSAGAAPSFEYSMRASPDPAGSSPPPSVAETGAVLNQPEPGMAGSAVVSVGGAQSSSGSGQPGAASGTPKVVGGSTGAAGAEAGSTSVTSSARSTPRRRAKD